MNPSTEAAVLASYEARLVPLGDNLIAAAFPLMKIFPAEFCLRQAADQGLLERDTLVVESSSGTMAMGLAIVCRLRGHRLAIVSDSACDPLLRRRLEDLGTRVEVVTQPAEHGGLQQARLDRLAQIRAQEQRSFWVNQYGNPCNPGAYGPFASQLVESLGHVDCLVGTVGSGGSMCGTAGYLRELFPDLHVVGVDTPGSVLFGQPDRPRQLRGLGNSIHPANLDHAAFDEIHWVSAAEAYLATRLLHRASALFCGGTSGAAWMVAAHWAAAHPRARVVCVLPDDGFRYADTIYDDGYLDAQRLRLEALPARPLEVREPGQAGPAWSWMRWGRRSYAQVVGAARTSDRPA